MAFFGHGTGDATCACTSCSGTASSVAARACTLTTRCTCRPAAGGKTMANVSFSSSLHPDEHSAFMPFIFSLVDDRLAWASAHGVEMEEMFGHWRVPAINTL